MRLQALVYRNLPGENDEETFGPQTIVDEWDQVTGVSTKLLIGATTLSLEEVVEAIHAFGGLAIASHIDRPSYSLVSQLGFIPPGLDLDAVEVSPRATSRSCEDFPVVTSSDAHMLRDIGRSSTSFFAREASFEEIGKAFKREDGRSVCIH
jgi:PHP family Zn ribbon phosphoesterase